MDTKIDWTKPIEVFENDKWRSAEFVAEDASDVCFRLNGHLRIWEKGCDDIRNAPPVPAPAACEHSYSMLINGLWQCEKCGDRQERKPSPSPAPDSVELAKEWLTAYCNDSLVPFFRAYISEQTAQRKAAGELAEAVQQYKRLNDERWREFEEGWPGLADALAADASTRAGKDGGK